MRTSLPDDEIAWREGGKISLEFGLYYFNQSYRLLRPKMDAKRSFRIHFAGKWE